MSLSIQLYTLFSMIGVGAYLGMALDTYERLLIRRKRHRMFVFLTDVLFWIVQGILTFFLLLNLNDAEVRVYILIAMGIGFSFYQALVRTVFIKVLEQVVRFVLATTRFVRRLVRVCVVLPVIYVYRLLRTILMGLLTVSVTVVVFTLRVVWRTVIALCRLLFFWMPKSWVAQLENMAKSCGKMADWAKKWLKTLFFKQKKDI
ncbi:MAG: spore cortex biosynthesis protein YabQ [Bacilli bacterium]